MQLGGGLDLGRHARLRLNSWAAAPRPGGLPSCAGSQRIPTAWGELRTPAAGHRADSHSSSWTSRSAFNWQTASRSGSDEGQARPAGQLAGHFAPDSDHASRPPPGDQAPGQRWRAVSRTPAGGRCCSRDTVRRGTEARRASRMAPGTAAPLAVLAPVEAGVGARLPGAAQILAGEARMWLWLVFPREAVHRSRGA